MTDVDDLLSAAEKLSAASSRLADPEFIGLLDRVRSVIDRFKMASSGSWLGYHANVYYTDFAPPVPGDHFSQEWGLMHGKSGWREYDEGVVVAAIMKEAGDPDLVGILASAKPTVEVFEQTQPVVISRLTRAAATRKDDNFIKDLVDKAGRIKLLDEEDLLNQWAPRGQVMTRDMAALNAGRRPPPHASVAAKVGVAELPYLACKELGKLAAQAADHLSYEAKREHSAARIGSRIFIGHGQSPLWKNLKDFVQDRLRLPWDEFNRVPVAGVTNIARLAEMMDNAAIAFLVMTGEDEQSDGALRARENVVHEAGLFQGRLGFERAIILLEEGCTEFSNINGLGQIRFPKGNIGTIFEELRRVLEREGILEAPAPVK
ncbi:MAG: hypothetical protein FD157_1257 [Rhodocyclaceae bacterium]|nr:MAG: hypothetical protein FD157_1257 [Rhodocyclaceae bacterium]TND02750.1 MAG: hypothetical protein FD118_1776 [Rhodocyclaceae bacterium]